MSIPATNWVWGLNEELPNATYKLALMKHADHAHDDGTHTWQVVPTIAKFALCSTRTAQRVNDWLLENGYMREGDQSIIPAKYKNAKNKPVAYELAMNEDTRLRWQVEAANGANPIHDAAKSAGAKGAAKRAENKAANAQVGSGDNLSPQDVASTPPVETTASGDNLSPHARGDNDDANGVTDGTGRGDTGVTQTTQATTQGKTPPLVAPSNEAGNAPSSVAAVASPDGSASKKRGTRIPEDFATTLTAEMVEWARTECPDTDGRVETANFVDYWIAKPGKDGIKTDWNRTWKRWMRTSQQRFSERTKQRGTSYSNTDTWGTQPGGAEPMTAAQADKLFGLGGNDDAAPAADAG